MSCADKVTMIGLGAMGSALARAFQSRGFDLTIWNRSVKRAAPLVAGGARLATSAAEAIGASPLVVMCVYDYGAAEEILQSPGVAEALRGKTLVQLSTGSGEQMLAQQSWVRARGGQFVAGGVLAYPRAIGQPNCAIVYAGDADAFERHRATLAALAGGQQYVGSNPTVALGAYFSLSSFMIGALGLFFETAAVSRHYGVSIDHHYALVRTVLDEVEAGVRDGTVRVATHRFQGDAASIDLTVAGMTEVCRTFDQTGIPTPMTHALVDLMRLASSDGRGSDDLSAVTESLYGRRV